MQCEIHQGNGGQLGWWLVGDDGAKLAVSPGFAACPVRRDTRSRSDSVGRCACRVRTGQQHKVG